ncbi:hypothetical protein [Clostridium sp. Cult2]|uniref:hypothetical protein n=1 Tax=Clostridium sp. Cult2 TaxID=2079003 RepID=UPI001F1865E4|nr:hypothetical protein [Clostridium sp. Cult2]
MAVLVGLLVGLIFAIFVVELKSDEFIVGIAINMFAGAHLSLGYLTLFTENMSANRGFIALAVIIFGRANPVKTFVAALMFGFFDALGIRLQVMGIPSQFTQMIPYVATIVALLIVTKRQITKIKIKKETE